MTEKTLEDLKTGLSMFKTLTLIEIKELFKEKGVKLISIDEYYDRETLNIRRLELVPYGTYHPTSEETVCVVDNTEKHNYLSFRELTLDNIVLIYEWLLNNKENIKFV